MDTISEKPRANLSPGIPLETQEQTSKVTLALKAYRDDLAIRESLAKADPPAVFPGRRKTLPSG